YAFRIDLDTYDLGTTKVVFDRDAETTRVHLGGVLPLSAEKRPAAPRPRVWATRAAGALAVAGAASAVRRRASPADGRQR
ncbi:MAG TPA: hypothetical protein VK923_13995, partial [Euzebyales bacterium]|nr:hypothetical protein [Euzebyales bacterium]